MVGRGRKNVPTHLKLVKGTAKNSKGEIYEIQPDLAFPMPPPHLSDEAEPRRRTCRLDFVAG